MTAAAAGRSGLLVAEGDSWFDYPGADVLSLLEKRHAYRVESVAHHGDTIEAMAYDDGQLEKLVRIFQHVKQDGRVPRAILISGGGNDIAGSELSALLNHLESGLPPLNEQVMAGIIDERLRFAVASVIGTVTTLSQQLFGRPIPVSRGPGLRPHRGRARPRDPAGDARASPTGYRQGPQAERRRKES